ncbi:MAG: Rrf2 family transcriptional regulator [Leptospiraceae bacterium]|nr:Rrf2 family transcriptional regulator [Leptospiraceae bacterium]
MLDLVEHARQQKRVKSREIAERQQIPVKYLEQIINTLKRGGLLLSVRGADGGYRLSRPASEISVYEILHALEGDLSIIDKEDDSWSEGHGFFWQELEEQLIQQLRISLADFAANSRNSSHGYMYYI